MTKDKRLTHSRFCNFTKLPIFLITRSILDVIGFGMGVAISYISSLMTILHTSCMTGQFWIISFRVFLRRMGLYIPLKILVKKL